MKDEFEKSMRNIPMLDAPTHTPAAVPPTPASITGSNTGGFTPVNAASSGGFTAVNASGGFTPVNAAPARFAPVNIVRRDREETGFTPPRRPYDSPTLSAVGTPEYRPSTLSQQAVLNGFTSNPALKRQLSHDSLVSRNGSQPPGDDIDASGRRSKRLKKGTYFPLACILHKKLLSCITAEFACLCLSIGESPG